MKSLFKIYLFFEEIKNVKNWKDLIELGITNPRSDETEKIQSSISEDDLFTNLHIWNNRKPKRSYDNSL